MNSFANSLKSEIARVARKELKDEIASLRKATTAHRSEIATLKREVKGLRSQLKANEKVVRSVAPPKAASDEVKPTRMGPFSATTFVAQRKKLGLTQSDMAKLLGVSSLSVYKWETGKVQPRAAQLSAIASIRKIGKREAAARLAAS